MKKIVKCYLSQEGREHFVNNESFAPTFGYIVGESRDKSCWYVKWQGKKSSSAYSKDFIVFGDKEEVVLWAWAVMLPGTTRLTASSTADCPDGRENNQCLKFDVYERKYAAVEAAKVYPKAHQFPLQIQITYLIPPRKTKKK